MRPVGENLSTSQDLVNLTRMGLDRVILNFPNFVGSITIKSLTEDTMKVRISITQ